MVYLNILINIICRKRRRRRNRASAIAWSATIDHAAATEADRWEEEEEADDTTRADTVAEEEDRVDGEDTAAELEEEEEEVGVGGYSLVSLLFAPISGTVSTRQASGQCCISFRKERTVAFVFEYMI